MCLAVGKDLNGGRLAQFCEQSGSKTKSPKTVGPEALKVQRNIRFYSPLPAVVAA